MPGNIWLIAAAAAPAQAGLAQGRFNRNMVANKEIA
jgi:hypothetical protein